MCCKETSHVQVIIWSWDIPRHCVFLVFISISGSLAFKDDEIYINVCKYKLFTSCSELMKPMVQPGKDL